MHFHIFTVLTAAFYFLCPTVTAQGKCTYAKKVAGIQHEIDTISSHSFQDANQIPLAPFASRTFLVTPGESPGTLLEVNTGVTAQSVRTELVGLATFLNAKVPKKSLHYIKNANGSVTSDFVQLNRFTLKHASVRELHYFNEKCEITKIIGYVHANLVCPSNTKSLDNSVMFNLCKQYEAVKEGRPINV